MKTFLSYEWARFVLAGIINTLVGYIFFALSFYFLNDKEISLALAYILGILFNYNTYSEYVFKSNNRRKFMNFLIIYLFIFVFNSLVLKLFESVLNLSPYFYQLFAIVILTPMLYLLNKKYVFIKDGG